MARKHVSQRIDYENLDVGVGQLAINNVEVTATAAEINRVADTSARLVAGGSTLSISEDLHDGKTILLDTAAGTTITLPAATGSGNRYRFVVSVTATSNSHKIQVTLNDTFKGFVNVLDLDGAALSSYAAAADSDTITMNRTTTGGVVGDWIEVEDIKTDVWSVKGQITCVVGSNPATPFSAAVPNT